MPRGGNSAIPPLTREWHPGGRGFVHVKPALAPRLVDAGEEVGADLHDSGPLSRVRPVHRTPQASLSELAEHGCQLAFHLAFATESSCEEVGQLGAVGRVADYDRGVTLGRFLPTRTRFACEDRSVGASYVIFLKGPVVTLGMVLGDFSSRASTRER